MFCRLTKRSDYQSSVLPVLLIGIAALATAKESRIRVSTHDLEWTLGDSSRFQVFIDPPPNETVLVSLIASKGEDLLADSSGHHVIEPGSEGGIWLNLSARKAGYAVIHLNASLPGVDSSNAFVRISVLHLAWLNVLSAVFGWLYFIAWSISFYPQIYLNWKRRSVVGLSFDFIGLNLTGFLAYSFFNLGVYCSPVVQSVSGVPCSRAKATGPSSAGFFRSDTKCHCSDTHTPLHLPPPRAAAATAAPTIGR